MKKIKFVTLLLAAALLTVAFTACASKENNSAEKINTTIILVLEDKSEVKYNIDVSKSSSLREGLYEAKLISEETYGAMFIEDIDGHVADVENDGVTWMISDKDGKQIQKSFDEVILEDGGTLYLTYYVVPDFD